MKYLFLISIFSVAITNVFAQQKVNAPNQQVVDLKNEIAALKEKINAQDTQIEDLNWQLETMQQKLEELLKADNREYKMSDAYPNPSGSRAVLSYFIDEKTDNACICIYDMTGKKMREYPLLIGNESMLQMNLSNCETGNYFYVLIADGATIFKKQLVVVR